MPKPSNRGPALAFATDDIQYNKSSGSVSVSRLVVLQVRGLLGFTAFLALASLLGLVSCLLFWWAIIPLWACAEAAFLVWFTRTYRRLNSQPRPHRPPPHVNPREVFDRFIKQQGQVSKYINILDMVSRWHWNVAASKLTRRNVAHLLTYGFYYRSRAEMEAEGMGDEPDRMVRELEEAWGVRFADDSDNDAANCSSGGGKELPIMAHLWEPVRCFYRPLAFYAGIEVLMALKHTVLLAMGFRAHMHKGMRYYTYGMPTNSRAGLNYDAATAPVLFLHGVGLGLLPYINFFVRLACLAPSRPLVAVEVRHLSMRLCSEVPDEEEVAARIEGALDEQGVGAVHAVAHSYGTFMASRLVQRQPQRVASLTLLDPVCFCMFSGKLIYNFVYRSPLQGSSLITWFIARDMAHAVSVSRRFYWSMLNLWPDQLPDHTLVALGIQDELVPVQEVLTMLREQTTARVLRHHSHRHADFIKDLPWQSRMVDEVAELVAHACSGAPPVARLTEGGLPQQGATRAGRSRHVRSDSASSYGILASMRGSDGGVFSGKAAPQQLQGVGAVEPTVEMRLGVAT